MKKDRHLLSTLIGNYLSKRNHEGNNQKLLVDFASYCYNNQQWGTEALGNKEELSKTMFKNISQKIDSQNNTTRHIKLIRYSASMAASIALLAAAFYFFQHNHKQYDNILTKTTGASMDSLLLQDGSKVYLSANTTVSYPEVFSKKNREITLANGNAFFEVAKDPSRPFIISSGDIKTKVLGTSFNIQLKNDSCLVSVLTGKVNVSSMSKSVYLSPNEEVAYSHSTNTLQKRANLQKTLTSWFNDDLELNNVALKEVFDVLQYKYGTVTDIHDEKILGYRATIFIEKNTSLPSIIDQLNYITNGTLKFNINNNKITIE